MHRFHRAAGTAAVLVVGVVGSLGLAACESTPDRTGSTASASPRHTPAAARRTASTEDAETLGSRKPCSGGRPTMSLRASTSHPVSGGTTNDAVTTTTATPPGSRRPAAARS